MSKYGSAGNNLNNAGCREEIKDAMQFLKDNGLAPIRKTYDERGYYDLRAANGTKRCIASYAANTVLATYGHPRKGSVAMLWMNASPVK